jgi:vacuolar-type H+-ATPase subunit H
MRYLGLSMLIGLALSVAACNESDQRDARAKMHDAHEEAKKDLDKAKQDLKQAKSEFSKDYKEADRETEKALSSARDKIHQTLRDQNVTDHKDTNQK